MQQAQLQPWVRRMRAGAIAWLLLLAALTAWWVRGWRLVNDPAQLHYVCLLIQRGFVPYSQLVEMNMPGTYLMNGGVMRLLGGGDVAWHLFDAGLMAAMLVGMVAICRNHRGGRDWFAGAFAGLLFILMHAGDGSWQLGQRDLAIAVLLVLGYAAMFAALRRGQHGWMLLFGICFGAAATIKPTPLPFALLLVCLVEYRWRRLRLGNLASPVVPGLAGVALPLAGAGWCLVRLHAVHGFLYALRVQLPFYATLDPQNLPNQVAHALPAIVFPLACIAAAVWWGQRAQLWPDWEQRMLLLGWLFGMACYFVQHKGFAYHRYPAIAFLLLLCGTAISRGLDATGRPALQRLAAVGVVVGLLLAAYSANRARNFRWQEEFDRDMTADLLRLQAQPGSQLGPRSLQNKVQCLATLPDCDTVLYRLQMVQATGLMYDYFLFLPATSQAVQDARQQFWRQINQRPPQVFVVARGPFPTGRPEYQRLQSWPEFEQFLAQKYSLYDEHEYPQEKDRSVLGFRMYVKKQPQ